jgi:hypothetical protein
MAASGTFLVNLIRHLTGALAASLVSRDKVICNGEDALRDRSTSLDSVVAHEETLTRIALRPFQTVAPHQQVPSPDGGDDFRRALVESQ